MNITVYKLRNELRNRYGKYNYRIHKDGKVYVYNNKWCFFGYKEDILKYYSLLYKVE